MADDSRGDVLLESEFGRRPWAFAVSEGLAGLEEKELSEDYADACRSVF